MMNGKTISILSGILLCAVLLAGIPAKDAIPGQGAAPVSYTHLTLPTICSV